MMKHLPNRPCENRNDGGVKGAAKRLVKKKVNATLEPHKNAYNGKAKGFEILVLKGDSLSRHYAELFAEAFKVKFPDRVLRGYKGIKEVSGRDNGAANLRASKNAGAEVALLSESFFIDNPNEWIEPREMAHFWAENL